MGWDVLHRWGDVRRVERLAGGARNDVRAVEFDGGLLIARRGSRSQEDLAWEARLLAHLDAEGLAVPRIVPTEDGQSSVDGIVVMEHVDGSPPESESDWKAVANYLGTLHDLTGGWPQRPGWASSTDLLAQDVATSIDLTGMPKEGVARCRSAWARLAHRDQLVVHGDPNPANIRIRSGQVALIDWDEARVDVPDLDLVLPYNAACLSDDDLAVAAQAVSAWEAAVCWAAEPEYAARRLAEVRTV